MVEKIKAIISYRKQDEDEIKEIFKDQEDQLYFKEIPDIEFTLMTGSTESMEMDISDEEFLFLADEAHKKDITLNNLINMIIVEELKKEKIIT